ncbi:High-affinity Na(+)/H(+) antiporter NhaS3 [Enhygromyxa salina]|uniref:High-affinity Na(+)/H(+) antiporter NhaS3 n=1 Tax=Enhygromyxa salina TaxID=215803 RepID=A0A2S9YB97_9BACT|nr:cation:proton antiporter [Enhygromyxa salina]PRQ02384.1 High-affinity Na(+)/H(+) antiporter NhaS3 [Enhygromyxa salina]
MGDGEIIEPLLLVSGAILAATLISKVARRLRVPGAVGFLLVGLALRALDSQLDWVSDDSASLLALLGELGVAALLFRVGLESKLDKLLEQLPRASLVWAANVSVSGALGFAAAWSCGLGALPSTFVAVAFSATSIGLSVAVWQELGKLDTPLGALLVDVAELDDLSAIVLTSMLVLAAPAIHAGTVEPAALAEAIGWIVLQLVGFGAACYLFSRYLEERLTRLFAHDEGDRSASVVLFLVGTGLAVAAIAGALGLSVAIGALFAGLMFSRDPEAIRAEHSFEPIHALFVPFFFLDIGFGVDLEHIGSALGLGAVLLVPAVLGKVGGVMLPFVPREGWRVGVLMGVSMVPRAEIALVVARLGNRLGEWAVSDRLYGALVVVCAATAIFAPVVLQRMFLAWPDAARAEAEAEAEAERG